MNREIPILDSRELAKIDFLTKQYMDYIAPGRFSKLLKSTGDYVSNAVPEQVKKNLGEYFSSFSELDFTKNAMSIVAEGFAEIEAAAAKMVVSKKVVIDRICITNPTIVSFDDICYARSYDIETILNTKDVDDLLLTAVQGGTTGAFGFYGIPFNIVLCTFLYFRAVQSIALHYGYDVQNDPYELEIASVVTMQALNPNAEASVESISAVISKMMLMTQATLVREGLKKTYSEMAAKGGVQLLFVQIRALANSAAKKAIEKAGEKGLERTALTEMLEQLGKFMTKSASTKGIPIISAFFGMTFDTAFMLRVLKYAKIVYHKRFLVEKEQRVFLREESRLSNLDYSI